MESYALGGRYENSEEIMRCLAVMKANIQLDDWANNIFAGMVYSSLGCKEEAEECVMCNIDFGFETEVSGRLLARMELDELPQRAGTVQVHSLESKDAHNDLKGNADSEKLYQLGKNYIQRVRKAENYSLIVFVIVLLVLGYEGCSYVMTDSFLLNIFAVLVVAFFVIIGMSLSADKLKKYIARYTSEYIRIARDSYTEAAENGNIDAMYELGKWGIRDKNEDEAINWFRRASLSGHIESQKILSRIYGHKDDYEAYMWAYLADLCMGTLSSDDEMYHENYSLSGFKLMAAEAEAQKIYDGIQKQRRQNK